MKVANEGFVIDSCQFRYDLYEKAMLVIMRVIMMGNQSKDVSIDIKGIFEVGYLILEMAILLAKELLKVHHYYSM